MAVARPANATGSHAALLQGCQLQGGQPQGACRGRDRRERRAGATRDRRSCHYLNCGLFSISSWGELVSIFTRVSYA